MKHGVMPRATTMHLEHAAGDDRSIVETGTSPTRSRRSVSEAIVSRLVTGYDAIAVFGAGVAAIHWDRTAIDWRLNGIVVLLGAVLGVNFLHLAGAHRFDQFGDMGAAIGRALLPPSVMVAPIVWLASPLSDGITGARFVGKLWDGRLPPGEAAAKAREPSVLLPVPPEVR